MNRFGINLWNWIEKPDARIPELIKKAAAMGFTAIEFPMNETVLPCEEKTAKLLSELNLESSLCACLTAGRDISSFDETVRKNTFAYFAECFKTAEKIGAKIFAGPLYAGGGKCCLLGEDDKKREWALAVTGLQQTAELAADHGLVLAIEPIHRYRTSVVNTASQALQLVDDIGMKNVGVHFDTYHANIEETDLTAALETVLKKEKLAHLHACANNRGAPGTGHLPWGKIFGLLKTHGYTGHITMETFVQGALDTCWYKLAPSQDALAEEGLRNLKKMTSV